MSFVAAILILVLFLVFRLGSQASAGVALNDPVVWVEDGARGRILQINGATEEVTATITVGENNDRLQVLPRGRDAVFLNQVTGELGVIGASSLSVDSTEDLIGEGEESPAGEFVLYADFEASRSGFVVAPDQILIVEPGAGSPIEIVTDGGLGDRVVDGRGALVAITPDATRVGATNELGQFVTLATLPQPLEGNEGPPLLARSSSGTFVVDASRRAVNEILPDGSLGQTTCVSGSLSGVRVGGNVLTETQETRRVLVHDPSAGILSVSLPDSSDCWQIPLDGQSNAENWGNPVAVDEFAYLPDFENGLIMVVDLEERAVVNQVRFGVAGREFELEVFDGAVWANEPLGSLAAVLRGDEVNVISKITRIGGAGGDGDGDGIDAAPDQALQSDEVIFDGEGDVGFGGDTASLDAEGIAGAVADPEETDIEAQDLAELPLTEQPTNAPVILDVEPVPEEVQVEELVANFVFSSDTINVGEIVELTDTSIGSPTSWNWDFGDGTGANGPEVAKAWEDQGVFTVTLFVANEGGQEASQSFDFTVVASDLLRVPTADFSFPTDTIEVGDSLQFVDTSTGDPDVLLWSFGDGETDTGSVVSHAFDQPGQFTVSLTASNEAGSNTANTVITVVESVRPPEAAIGPFPTVVEVGQSIILESESTNSPTTLDWDFDDGDFGTGTTVRHSWSEPGEYRIRLSVSNSAGSDETFDEITVVAAADPPIARFNQSPGLDVVLGTPISFNDLSQNNPETITWEFGDNTTAQGGNVVKTYASTGTFTVTLTVENDAGSDSVNKTVTVREIPVNAPVASFTVPAGLVVPVNQPLRFRDSSTGDPTEYEWDFGDGSNTANVRNPVHSFTAPGTFTVRLTASNGGGSSAATQVITVVDPPVASFTSEIDELVVQFTDTSINEPTEWNWDFGDGRSSNAQNPEKTYRLPGEYTVTLTVANAGGNSAEFVQTVTVNEVPTADFTFTTAGLTAQFTNESEGAPTSFLWDFGDGTTSPVRNPRHLFDEGGDYVVMLTVTNAAGSDTALETVTVVNAPPVAAFTCAPAAGEGVVSCSAEDSTGAAEFEWFAEDANTPRRVGENAAFGFPESGTYPIRLTVRAADGQSDTITQTIPVTVALPPPNVAVSAELIGNSATARAAGTVTNGQVVTWSWEIDGDGVITAGGATASPTFSLPSPGTTYTITGTGTNVNGSGFAVDTVTTPAAVPPVVGVTAALVGDDGATATGTVTNGPVTWSWEIDGDGVITAGGATASPTFSLPSPGTTYTITGTGTNANGSDVAFDTVTTPAAAVPPVPVVTIDLAELTSPDTALAAATADQAIVTWTWTISAPGVTIPGLGSTATFDLPAPGTSYTITVTATNANGTSAPVTTTVTSGP